jgi:hypothetical protein
MGIDYFIVGRFPVPILWDAMRSSRIVSVRSDEMPQYIHRLIGIIAYRLGYSCQCLVF